jgi:gluconolactonase
MKASRCFYEFGMTPEMPIEQFEVFAKGISHPACIAFDRHGDLWAGSESGQIYRILPNGKVHPFVNLGSYCAGLAISPQEELFVCSPGQGIIQIKLNGEWSVFASHVGEHKLISPSCGAFDSAGNFYVTDSGNWKRNNGYLYRYKPGCSDGEILAGPIGFANGLALAVDEKSFFMVESNTERVLRYHLRPDGSLSEAEVYAEDCSRFPTGLTLDAEGNVYVSCYASDEIWRITPSLQKTLFAWDRWAMRLGSPTNMAFGGTNLDELYFANLARTQITRVKTSRRGQPLANQRIKTKLRPRPIPL